MNMNAGAIGNDEDKVRNGFYIGNQSVITEQNFYVKIQFSKIDRSTKSAKMYEIVNRIIPQYNFKSLNDNINDFLDSVSPPGELPLQIRRYYNRFFRYLEAYGQEKDVTDVFAIVKEFLKQQKSHRKLGENQ
ncbi:hypothetical protein HPULCUR_005444 [Helicostylum pulchrum]|uniref:Uncharacterized protein n=1 Tax=Helicostylum pulchrum TaxID=562976 RepID=A0ABP9XZ40_9FUNG